MAQSGRRNRPERDPEVALGGAEWRGPKVEADHQHIPAVVAKGSFQHAMLRVGRFREIHKAPGMRRDLHRIVPKGGGGFE